VSATTLENARILVASRRALKHNPPVDAATWTKVRITEREVMVDRDYVIITIAVEGVTILVARGSQRPCKHSLCRRSNFPRASTRSLAHARTLLDVISWRIRLPLS